MNSRHHGNRAPVRFSGQHFLNDKTLIEEMIQIADIRKNNMVLDIGAGKGALTRPLSEKAGRVIAIECDSGLSKQLREKLSGLSGVKILEMDFMNMPLPGNPFKVVSNIPYSLTTNILGKLMDNPCLAFKSGVIMTELGAARRFTKTMQPDPRIIAWASWFQLEIVRNADASSFIPPPRVKSCVIKVTRQKNAIIKPMHHRRYLAFLDKHLSHPEMSVSNSMKKTFTWNQVSRICKDAGINKNAPVISLTPGQWGLFFNTMLKLIPSRLHPSLPEKYRRLYIPYDKSGRN